MDFLYKRSILLSNQPISIMDINEIKSGYKKIQQLLFEKRIKEALDTLGERARQLQVALFIDEVYSLELSYKRIVDFSLYGLKDPHKDVPYTALELNIHLLSDQINSELCEHYYIKYLKNKLSNNDLIDDFNTIYNRIIAEYNINDEAFILLREESLSELFNSLAFSAYTSNSNISLLKEAFSNSDFKETEKLNLISSIYFSLTNYFDERKIQILIDLVESNSSAIAARASVVFAMMIIKYDNRLSQYPSIQIRISSLKENIKYQERFKTIFFQLLNAKQTEKISQKFTNEILPEMIKINPIIKKKLDLENLLSDNPKDEAMPNWDDLINESPELIEKIDQIHKMQQEGFDLLSTTFKNLKTFPFFQKISNWFVPFTNNQSYVSAIARTHNNNAIKQLIYFLRTIPNVCNSDKYSMLFAMEVLPALYKDMIGKMPTEEELDEHKLSPETEFKNHSNLYIQDLYRFLTAYPNRAEFENIFEFEFEFSHYNLANELIPTSILLKDLAQYYFKNQLYASSSKLYIQYIKNNEPQVDILQKIGFAYQQLNNYENALSYYQQAELFDKNKEWNCKKIAICFRNLNQPQKALQYYLLAEIENPENLHTQAAIGQCHIELHNYTEALKHYFKVEFLDQSNTKIWRPIAWCSYVLGRFDLSEKYYLKLLELDNVSELDIMSYGNLLLAMGKREESIKQYTKSISPNFSITQFVEIFNQEAIYLKQHGIDDIEIATMLDKVRYILENNN